MFGVIIDAATATGFGAWVYGFWKVKRWGDKKFPAEK